MTDRQLFDHFVQEINRSKFYNTSFREYICHIKNYIIVVNPFSIKLYEIGIGCNLLPYIGPECLRGMLRTLGINLDLLFDYHHQDFNKGIIGTDPCGIFEDVCGINIYRNESDIHLMDLDRSKDILGLKGSIKESMRNDKISEIFKI